MRGAWAEARERFEESLAEEESAPAYEGLGVALRYLWDVQAAVSAHERGYRLARSGGDREAAARLAVQLAIDAYGLGKLAEANGWTERALMLTDAASPTEARALALALVAHVALLVRNDPVEARVAAEQALHVARAAGSSDVEILAVALEGLALVCEGAVGDGMRRLDAATAAAVAGEVADVDFAETICCYLIDACKRVRDLDRAAEWCRRVQEIAARYEDRFMFSVCRIHHADVLVWRGEWAGADGELAAAAEALRTLGSGKVADSLVRLAELRRRQGRREEAATLLAECEAHRLHALHAGLLALDAGDVRTALESAQRFLRRVGERDRFERVAGLELVVRAALGAGDRETAATAVSELVATAAAVATRPLQASALLAEGRLAAADGEHAGARASLEDAADAFDAAGAPHEAAQARLELAAVLRALGREREAADVDAGARAVLARIAAPQSSAGGATGGLSRREVEVLRYVARGCSNDEIAAALVLSVRTVERHVANVYRKLRLSGRTARASATAWAHLHGIT